MKRIISSMNIIIFIVCNIIIFSPLQAQQTGWTQYSIPGFVYYLSNNFYTPGLIYGTGPGGVYCSSNGGKEWKMYDNSYLRPSDPSDVLYFDYSNPNHWFIINWYFGIIESFDAGKSFQWFNTGLLSGASPGVLAQNPFNSKFYLLGGGSLYKSTDNGASWRNVKFNLSNSITNIVFDPSKEGRVYAIYHPPGADSYLLISNDDGEHWQKKSAPNSSSDIIVLPDGTLFYGSAKSTDQGRTWKSIFPSKDNLFNGTYINKMLYNPKDKYIYALDEDGLMKIKDSDSNWIGVLKIDGLSSTFCIDTLTQSIYVSKYDTLYVSTDQAPFIRIEMRGALPTVCQIVEKSSGSDTLFAAVSEAGFYSISFDKGKTWSRENTWQLTSAAFEKNSTFIYATTRADNFIYSLDLGKNFIYPQSIFTLYSKCKINPLQNNYIYYSSINGLLRSTKQQLMNATRIDDLDNLTTQLGQGIIYDFAFHPKYPQTIFILHHSLSTGASNVFKTPNSGMYYWTQLTNNTNPTYIWKQITIDPNNVNNIYVAAERDGIIFTHDGGVTWVKATGQFESDAALSIVVDPRNSKFIYACTSTISLAPPGNGSWKGGIYYSSDYGVTWQKFDMTNLLNFSIYNLQYFTNPPRLIASTSAGAYEYILPDITDVKEETNSTLSGFELTSIYPNPVSLGNDRRVLINYQIAVISKVRLILYDIFGREIKTIIDEQNEAGEHQVQFDATHLNAGIYFLKLCAGTFSAIKKFAVMR